MNDSSIIQQAYTAKQSSIELRDLLKEIDPAKNPYDVLFSEDELTGLREYAALFIRLWKTEHDSIN